jgi:capsular polysaccharide biosynthesis protein
MKPSTPQEGVASASGNRDYDYGPGQPNLYRIMRHKQALCAAAPLSEAFQGFRQTFGLAAELELQSLPVLEERAFAASRGLVFVESAKPGEPFVHPAPLVLGEGNQRPIAGVTRSQYLACLAHARVRGRSALIRVAEGLLRDVQDDEPLRLDDELEWDPCVFQATQRHAWYIPAKDEESPSLQVEEAFSMLGAHTDFFGHWMCEYLPKYIAADLSGVLPSNVPVLIDQHMPASHRQSLELLFPRVQLIEVPAFRSVEVARLWCAPTLMFMPLHEVRNEKFSWDDVTASPDRFAPVVREMVRRADAALRDPPTGGGRFFLARKAFRHRKLLNAPEIEAAAAAQGFAIVYPEDLGFAAQVSLLRGADRILASEGSAIFLAFFARAGAKLCILSHPFTDVLSDYTGILQLHDVQVSVLTGPVARLDSETPHDSDYVIDAAQFLGYLRDWQG